ncbi:ATP-binding protein [Streptomyces tailanensis]|uniref:ATP-binding protein n=1 Tax=Streptomyces tailanensis TaxID=2569858 RepID=UPI00122DD7BE|nr:ATP-binding protein [Streptomyces tailanensis]
MVTVSPSPIPAWYYALHLPHDPRAPRIARMTSRAVLSAYGLGELIDTAELLASELVTNAYRHTNGPAALRLRGLDGLDGEPRNGVRITVWDTDPHVPSPFDKPLARRGALRPVPGRAEQPDESSVGGRGLLLVHEWADRWGGHRLGDDLFGCGGKALWFELEARSGADAKAVA